MTRENVRLARCVSDIRDGTHGTFERVSEGVPLLSAKNITDAGLRLSPDESLISSKDAAEITRSQFPQRGDVLLTIVGTIGRTSVYDREESLPFQRSVAMLRPADHVEGRFLAYQLRTTRLQTDMVLASNASAQSGLYLGALGNLRLRVPPLDEQRAIADFLDEQTSRIDTLIGKQAQLIDTLRERRQALLLRAVTKGLDSTATLRSSGLGWAGDIPEKWDVANIRRYAAMKTGHTPSRSTPEYWTDCHIPWVTLADVWQLRDGRATYLQEDTQTRISDLGLANSAAELLPAGTVVLSRTASVGFSGIMPVPMATSQDYWNWVCGPSLLPTFLLAMFRAMRDEFRSLMIGSTHQTIYQPIAAAMSVVVPPIDEQREIVAHIDRQTSQIDALIAKAEEFIGLARERRAALITAAVTGQIDVRTAGRAATVGV